MISQPLLSPQARQPVTHVDTLASWFLIRVSKSIDDDAKCGLDGTMKIKFVLAGYVTLFSFMFVSSVLPADTKSAIEQALRDLDAHWSAAAGAKDLEKTISFYSEDAIVLP